MNYYELLGLKNPYNRYKNNTVKEFIHGWTGHHSFLKEIVELKKPKTVIEVGSFLGQSAINMGAALKALNLESNILCVDTWLGSPEHWRNDKCNNLNLFNYFETGISTLYDQFIQNVIANKLEDVIVPIPNTSAHVYEILNWKNVKADLIYIDASHNENDVYDDITRYSKLLNPDGIIFGDDYSSWVGVKNAVTRYMDDNKNKKFKLNYGNFWEISNESQ